MTITALDRYRVPPVPSPGKPRGEREYWGRVIANNSSFDKAGEPGYYGPRPPRPGNGFLHLMTRHDKGVG